MAENTNILIVEDRSIVAAQIKRDLERAGYSVVALAGTQAAAIDLARRIDIDGAILDIDLRGEPAYPVAAIFRERGIPFLFLSGYSRAALPAPWQDVQLVEKPFEPDRLVDALRAAIRGEQATPASGRITSPTILRAWDAVRHTRDMVTEQRAWSQEHNLAQKPR